MVVESPHQRLVPFWHDDDGKTLMRRRVQRVPRLPGGQEIGDRRQRCTKWSRSCLPYTEVHYAALDFAYSLHLVIGVFHLAIYNI